MPKSQRPHALLLAAVLAGTPGLAFGADPPAEVQAVDALNTVFGKHPGFRANHAKGLVVEGSFTPSPDAASLTKAVIYNGGTVPVTVRFSDATGLPDIPDGNPNANPHGMAIKFHLPGGTDSDIVVNSLHVFPVRTVEEFVDLLRAVAATKADSPKPTPVEQFMGAHPAALPAFASAQTPASWATEDYFGIDAFIFTDKSGKQTATRYRIEPVAGVTHLDAAEAAKRAPNYLADEMRDRLSKGKVSFTLAVQVAEAGDPTNDATKVWPDSRKLVTLGTITLDHVAADSDAAQKALFFLPGALVDGVAQSDDPLIDSRNGAYAESYSRRSQ